MEGRLNSLAAVLVSALILCLSASPAAAMDDKELNKLYQAGKEYYEQKQYKLAFPLLYDAAKHGHPEAQMRIGKMLFNGWGTKHKHHEAKEWHEKAAAQGNKESIEKLKKWKH